MFWRTAPWAGPGVPSGASTGAYEAHELRDGDPKRYLGKGVRKAVEAVNGEIFKALKDVEAEDQLRIDRILCDLDGTASKERLGVQMPSSAYRSPSPRPPQMASGLSVFRYLGGADAHVLPSR